MDFDFQPPALVQAKKKYANFTIKEIGGPEEIIKWRQQQEAKDSIHRIRVSDREDRVKQVRDTIGKDLSLPTIHTSSWAEKLAFVDSEKKLIEEMRKKVIAYPSWVATEPPKLSLGQRIKSFFVNIFKSANF